MDESKGVATRPEYILTDAGRCAQENFEKDPAGAGASGSYPGIGLCSSDNFDLEVPMKTLPLGLLFILMSITAGVDIHGRWRPTNHTNHHESKNQKLIRVDS